MRIAVLGAGSWGTTVASLLAQHHRVVMWCRDQDQAHVITTQHRNPKYLSDFDLPSSLTAVNEIEDSLADAELVVAGVPSQAMRTTLTDAAPVVPRGVPIVSLSKGLEAGTLLRMSEVITEVLPGNPPAVLTGPNIAREIMEGSAAASVMACNDLALASELQDVMRTGLLRVYTNHDVIGCELGGVLKNVIAIAAGMAQGLGVGDNTRAAVMTRGLAEITRLGVALGGEAPTFAGLAGMGDLIATCISPYSRNRTVGERIGKGEPLDEIIASMNMVAEGVKSASTVHELANQHHIELTVCEEIYRVVQGELTAAEAYRGLRPAGHENEPG